MNIVEMADSVVLENAEAFEPKHIFECGQCFRFNRNADDSYTVIANKRVLKVMKNYKNIHLLNTTLAEFNNVWYNYFDLGFDYGKVKEEFAANDENLKRAVCFGGGIRLLHQDLFETIISFIISANNNIPRIKGIIERFCNLFGEKIANSEFYTFPDIKRLEKITVEDLKPLRAGFRDKYIIDAVNKINDGTVDLEKIKNSDTSDAEKELKKIKGIGDKVADCILLFGLSRYEVFPVDVWVKKVMLRLYGLEGTKRDIEAFKNKHFGEYAGLAQQYLFYYMRENKGLVLEEEYERQL